MAPQTSTKPTMQNKNVAGGMLSLFSKQPPVGFYKDGYCRSEDDDTGNHSIAATTPSGDRTCLSASEFASTIKQANEGKLSADQVPKVHLHASHEKALKEVAYKDLKKYAAEPEAQAGGRQEDSHDPNSNRGIAKENHSIGGDSPTVAPGAGKNQSKSGQQSSTSGSRG